MPDCSIWQACRATSAAPTFFPSVTIDSQQYVDGALGYNNPIRPLLDEAFRIWGDKRAIGCIVSIGTGVPRLGIVGEGATLAKTLKEMATDAQTVANEFKNEMTSRYGPDQQVYFRFNVERGLEVLGLEECQPRHQAQIQTATNFYLEEAADRIEICARNIFSPKGIRYLS
jgi:predicted acylesterase/phospholipase RssA